MVRLALALAAHILLAAAAPTEQSGTLTWLNGQWRGSGTMFGAPSTAELNVAPALGGRFAELRYRANGERGSSKFQFEGAAFYQPSPDANGAWTAQWFDSSGAKRPITAMVSGQVLTANWGESSNRAWPDGLPPTA